MLCRPGMTSCAVVSGGCPFALILDKTSLPTPYPKEISNCFQISSKTFFCVCVVTGKGRRHLLETVPLFGDVLSV